MNFLMDLHNQYISDMDSAISELEDTHSKIEGCAERNRKKHSMKLSTLQERALRMYSSEWTMLSVNQSSPAPEESFRITL